MSNNCKIVVNKDSGNCNKLNIQKLLRLFPSAEVEFFGSDESWNADGFDTVVVCGGDGTLHNALEICPEKHIVYVPCGTLNEACAKGLTSVGLVNGKPFTYVCATGSFSEIGYSAKNAHKKHWKALAYVPQIFRTYRCHEIAAQLNVDGKNLAGKFTLLMILRGERCFGFKFNKQGAKSGKLCLLAIRSPGADCLKNRIAMFFPFFKVFFCGATPGEHKNWLLLPFDELSVTLEQPATFCIDGEKRQPGKKLHFCLKKLPQEIEVVSARRGGY